MLLRLLIGLGTANLARIRIRTGHALRLVAALEFRLRPQAATGQNVKTSAERAQVSPRTRGNRSISPAHWRAAGTGTDDINPLEDGLPSEAQIAAMTRRGKPGVLMRKSAATSAWRSALPASSDGRQFATR